MEATNVNWELCIICEKRTQEKLQCPAISNRKDCGVEYISFVKNVGAFQDLNFMPVDFRDHQLDAGSGLDASLGKNKASCHKSFKDRFSNTKLERAKKRKQQESEEGSPIKTRRSTSFCSAKTLQ